MEEKIIIKLPYIILCEGKDDYNFLTYYFNSSALHNNPKFSGDIQVIKLEGIDNLSGSLSLLKKIDGYKDVERILIIRDADTNVDHAIKMVQNACAENGLPVPPSCNKWEVSERGLGVAFTLLPACSTLPMPGTLEDLCWDILVREDLDSFKNDVQTFVGQIREKYDSIGTHEPKSRLHTYFSVNNKYISMKVGEAAKSGAFNWGHEKLKPLKELIEAGF